MDVFPALDIFNGRAVRLEKGDFEKITDYGDPANIVNEFTNEGVTRMHVVDLDAARGSGDNCDVLKEISEATDAFIQVGGGIRSLEVAQKIADFASRIVLGTIAFTRPEIAKQIIDYMGSERIAISVDYKSGLPAINGWYETLDIDTEELQTIVESLGASSAIVTDIGRDGMMTGPNIELVKQWTNRGIEIMASGGVRGLEDVAALEMAGCDGVIVGKAIYEDEKSQKEILKKSYSK